MRNSQTITLEMSEKRQSLAETTARLNAAVAGGEEPAAEDIAAADTITKEMRAAEIRYRAAVITEEAEDRASAAVGDLDPETAEIRSLAGRSRVASYLAAATEMRAVGGPEAEYNAALGMAANLFPLEMLAPPEVRAASDASTTVTPSRWLDRLFADTAAQRLGVTMESVAPGVASFPVTTAGATAAQRGRAEAAADAAWTIGVTEIKPTRNTVRAVFSSEDAARLPGLEESLRRDLAMALAYGVDKAIFIGDAGANEDVGDIVGLTTAASVVESTLTQALKILGPDTLKAFSGLVNGIEASGFSDLNIVASVGAWRLWENTVLPSPVTTGQTIAAFLRESGLSWTSRGDWETATTNGTFGALVGRKRGLPGSAVAAVWSGAELIRDPYSGAAKGEVAITLSYLWGFKVPRPTNFARLKFVT